jgi:hypothetical protein
MQLFPEGFPFTVLAKLGLQLGEAELHRCPGGTGPGTAGAARLGEAIGTPAETASLKIGARCEVVAGQAVDVPGLATRDGLHAQLILNTGLAPGAASLLNAQLMRAALDGQCSETTPVRSNQHRSPSRSAPPTST